jgi:hypothetical protein
MVEGMLCRAILFLIIETIRCPGDWLEFEGRDFQKVLDFNFQAVDSQAEVSVCLIAL